MNDPDTADFTLQEVEGKFLRTCPDFNINGTCNVYNQRPGICEEFDCSKYFPSE